MLIAMDIGNSHVSFGGFDGDALCFVASIATDRKQTGEQYACTLQSVLALYQLQASDITGVVLCSVVPAMTPIVIHALSFLTTAPVLNVGTGVKTGLNIRIDQPRTLGTDRVATAAFAVRSGVMPCVIVDMGTATCFTVLDGQGALVGSAICAGMGISLEALKDGAAQLPIVALDAPDSGILGRTTVDAIRIGAVYGAAAMIDGMVERYSETLKQPVHVLLTGGSASYVLPYLRTVVQHEPYLSLLGLKCIWERNRT